MANVQITKTPTFKGKGNNEIVTVNERTWFISSNKVFIQFRLYQWLISHVMLIKKQDHTKTYNFFFTS